jgi:hypothetical protein
MVLNFITEGSEILLSFPAEEGRAFAVDLQIRRHCKKWRQNRPVKEQVCQKPFLTYATSTDPYRYTSITDSATLTSWSSPIDRQQKEPLVQIFETGTLLHHNYKAAYSRDAGKEV